MSTVATRLPDGYFVFVDDLPLGTTAEQLADYFQQHGMAVPADGCGMRDNGRKAWSLVSLPRPVFAMLVRWALNNDPVNGRVPTIKCLERPK
jgi:hypothetical protein